MWRMGIRAGSETEDGFNVAWGRRSWRGRGRRSGNVEVRMCEDDSQISPRVLTSRRGEERRGPIASRRCGRHHVAVHGPMPRSQPVRPARRVHDGNIPFLVA